jgi:hypothetical protein
MLQVRKLDSKGAFFYLCWSGKNMAPSGRKVCKQIYLDTVGCTEAEAATRLRCSIWSTKDAKCRTWQHKLLTAKPLG